MQRLVLDESQIHPAVRAAVSQHHRALLEEIQRVTSSHAVVVLGMRQNPFPKRARKALDDAGIAHHYLEYGSYFSDWRLRTAIKMWSGWPTFPMIFIKGQLVGGADDLAALLQSGEVRRLLAA